MRAIAVALTCLVFFSAIAAEKKTDPRAFRMPKKEEAPKGRNRPLSFLGANFRSAPQFGLRTSVNEDDRQGIARRRHRKRRVANRFGATLRLANESAKL